MKYIFNVSGANELPKSIRNSSGFPSISSKQSKRKASSDDGSLLEEESNLVRPARKQLISEEKIAANLRNLRLENNYSNDTVTYQATFGSETDTTSIAPESNLLIDSSKRINGRHFDWHTETEEIPYNQLASAIKHDNLGEKMDYCGTQDLDDANRSMKITSRVLIKDPLGNFEDDSFSDEEIDRNRNSEIVVNREVLERFPTSGDLLKDFLPQILIEKYNKPCLELIPYTPQSQFIHNVLKQTQASTSTAQKMSLEDCNEFYTPTIDDKEPNSERDVLVGGDEELDDYDDLIDVDYMDFT